MATLKQAPAVPFSGPVSPFPGKTPAQKSNSKYFARGYPTRRFYQQYTTVCPKCIPLFFDSPFSPFHFRKKSIKQLRKHKGFAIMANVVWILWLGMPKSIP